MISLLSVDNSLALRLDRPQQPIGRHHHRHHRRIRRWWFIIDHRERRSWPASRSEASYIGLRRRGWPAGTSSSIVVVHSTSWVSAAHAHSSHRTKTFPYVRLRRRRDPCIVIMHGTYVRTSGREINPGVSFHDQARDDRSLPIHECIHPRRLLLAHIYIFVNLCEYIQNKFNLMMCQKTRANLNY